MTNYCPIPGASQPKEQVRYIDKPVRLIDAREVMIAVFNAIEMDEDEYNAIKQEVDEIPTIDPESLRPTAHWIVTKTAACGINRYECSSCGAARYRATAFHLNYCQNCGKRMVNAYE